MAIASAFPMIFVIVLGAIGLLKSLRADHLHMQSVQTHVTTIQYNQASSSWRDRLNSILSLPDKVKARVFLTEIVQPALAELNEEFLKKGFSSNLVTSDDQVAFVVAKSGNADDFRYGVSMRSFEVPNYVENSKTEYCRLEVFLHSGGQDYDVFGYTKEQIIADAVTQYEKHHHYLHLSHSVGQELT